MVRQIRELRQKTSKFESTLLIDVELPEGESFKTAGNVLVFPENDPQNVRKALECVGLQEDQLLRIKPLSAKIKKPCPELITAGNLFRRFVDLQGILKVSAIKDLAKVVTDPTIKEQYFLLTPDLPLWHPLVRKNNSKISRQRCSVFWIS